MAVNIRERFKGLFKRRKTSELVKREDKGREAVINELRRGYSELVDTMHLVRQHMESQSKRSDRVMEVIEALPQVLQSIPESARQQNKTMEGLAESLRVQNRSTGELTQALSGLAEATRQQDQALSNMQDRLTDTLTRDEAVQQAMASGIDQMTQAVQGVTRDQQEGRTAIAQVAEQSRRQQKQMVAMNGVSWALAVLALGVAGWMAVTVSQFGPASITGRPASNVPSGSASGPEHTPPPADSAERDSRADASQTPGYDTDTPRGEQAQGPGTASLVPPAPQWPVTAVDAKAEFDAVVPIRTFSVKP